jgi:hypothetical protein
MRRPYLRAILCATGLCLLIAGVSTRLGSTSHAQAQPRPTLTPQLATPTAVQRPTRTPDRDDDDERQPAATGRITGTIIDLTSGAPAPGIPVQVGEVTITSDANGNYDRTGLPPGSYLVALVLTEGQGIPAQDRITIMLAADATVVQHLFFHSQPAASPTPVATVTAPPNQLPPTSGPAPSGWLWVVLGLGAIAIGGRLRSARDRTPNTTSFGCDKPL